MHKKHLGEEKGVRNPPNYKSELSDHLPRFINPWLVIEGKLLASETKKQQDLQSIWTNHEKDLNHAHKMLCDENVQEHTRGLVMGH